MIVHKTAYLQAIVQKPNMTPYHDDNGPKGATGGPGTGTGASRSRERNSFPVPEMI